MVDSFHKYIRPEAMDSMIVAELIDKIVIGEPLEKAGT